MKRPTARQTTSKNTPVSQAARYHNDSGYRKLYDFPDLDITELILWANDPLYRMFGVIDTGCSRAVIGYEFLPENYKQLFDLQDTFPVCHKTANGEVYSTKCITVPIRLEHQHGSTFEVAWIKVRVLFDKGSPPLLLQDDWFRSTSQDPTTNRLRQYRSCLTNSLLRVERKPVPIIPNIFFTSDEIDKYGLHHIADSDRAHFAYDTAIAWTRVIKRGEQQYRSQDTPYHSRDGKTWTQVTFYTDIWTSLSDFDKSDDQQSVSLSDNSNGLSDIDIDCESDTDLELVSNVDSVDFDTDAELARQDQQNELDSNLETIRNVEPGTSQQPQPKSKRYTKKRRKSIMHGPVQVGLTQKQRLCDEQLKRIHMVYGHLGSKRMYKLIKTRGSVTTHEQCKTICKQCRACALNKRINVLPWLHSDPNRSDNEPNQSISIDLLFIDKVTIKGRKVNLYAITILDNVIGFIESTAVLSKDEDGILAKFKEFWERRHGTPKTLLTDNGTEFNALKSYLTSQGVRVVCTPPYSPQFNGRNERSHSTFMQILRCTMFQGNLPFIAPVLIKLIDHYIPWCMNESPTKGNKKYACPAALEPDLNKHGQLRWIARFIPGQHVTVPLNVRQRKSGLLNRHVRFLCHNRIKPPFD